MEEHYLDLDPRCGRTLPIRQPVYGDLALNYLVGVDSGFAQDEGWNESASYSPWKFGSLLAVFIYACMTTPDLSLERNPFFHRLGQFF